MKSLTVFTPTFNRAYCLDQLYSSLVNQTNKDFCWMVIDDGSTDNTEELIKSWKDDNLIQIHYHFQENQGMHGGHNTAYSLIKSPLNVCIDSDDFMPHDAVQLILDKWEIIRDNPKYAGIVGLDSDKSGKIIGTKIPEKLKETTLYSLYHQHNVEGDKKLVYKTEVVRKYPPYPLFEGERFVPLGYLYQLIDQDYKLYPANEVYCIVEYMPDGSSRNMLKQYRRHPNGFAFSRKSRIKLSKSFKEKFKNAIHYVSSSLFLKNRRFISEAPNKPIVILAIPFGILLNLYIRYNTKDGY